MLSRKLLGVGGTALTYVNFATAVGSGTSVTCSVPSGCIAGDLLIAVGTQSSSSTASLASSVSGWTETLDEQGRYAAYLPSYDGTTANYTFAKAASCNPHIAIIAFRNAAFDVQGALSDTGSATPITGTATLSKDGSIILACFCSMNSTATFSQPTGFTEIIDTGFSLAVSIRENANIGGTGSVQSTMSSGSQGRGFLIGIKPK